jgi:hypothetical protein
LGHEGNWGGGGEARCLAAIHIQRLVETTTYISAVPYRIDTLAALFGEMVTDPRVASMQGD